MKLFFLSIFIESLFVCFFFLLNYFISVRFLLPALRLLSNKIAVIRKYFPLSIYISPTPLNHIFVINVSCFLSYFNVECFLFFNRKEKLE